MQMEDLLYMCQLHWAIFEHIYNLTGHPWPIQYNIFHLFLSHLPYYLDHLPYYLEFTNIFLYIEMNKLLQTG